jgi:uncharacterized protein YyaL (SSP411 family)
MGGWPTTAFLSPDGSTLTGATYLPPEQMRRALDEIANFYRENKGAIAERSLETRSKRATYRPSSRDDLREAMVVRLVEEITDSFDEEYGGFGDAPKFPQPDVHEFLLSEWRLTDDRRLYDVVAKTMLGMARGGMYDHVEGGFFRYSTTRDWSVPHFEKMAEDHAGLLRMLAQLTTFGASQDFRATLVSASNYVRNVLRDGQTGLFAGSQDADETYYELPLDERRRHGVPYVDRTSYTNWTCGLASGLLWAGRALDDDAILAAAMQCLDRVHDTLLDEHGLAFHFIEPGGTPQIRGLLTDQVAYARALLDAHEIAGEERFLTRARAIVDRTVERFAAEDGGFYDRIPSQDALARLEIPDRPIGDNGTFAEALLRLAVLTGESGYRDVAERTLALFARTYAAAGPFASAYARALRRFLSPEVSVRIAGTAKSTDAFRETALRLPNPFLTVRTGSAEALGLPPQPHPAAYVCVGTVCGPPAAEAAGLRAAYDAVAGSETPAVVPRT